MPNVPKQPLPRLASTTSPIPLELPVSRQAAPPPSQPPRRAGVIRVGPPVISPRNYPVDPDKVIKQLFGKAIEFNEATGVCNLNEPRDPSNMVPAGIPVVSLPR